MAGWRTADPTVAHRLVGVGFPLAVYRAFGYLWDRFIGGVTDYNAEYSLPEHASKPSAAIRQAPPADVKVLLAHQPKSIYQAAEAGFDFQLSGHTHGGQIFPGHFLMAMTQPYLSGMHRYRDTHIYVSSGCGSWGPKLRLGSTAEITAIVLSAA